MSIRDTITFLQQECTRRKGAYVFYSQCLEPTNTLINMLPYTRNGICQALSAKWIAEHANDSSLWYWLFASGTTNVKQASFANLMVNFTESVQRTGAVSNPTTRDYSGGDFYQDHVTDKYLSLYKVKRRGAANAGFMGSMSNQLPVGSWGTNLANRFQESWLNARGGSYILISIMGNGGHAMAAYVGKDIAFFDPNFGEYWMPDTNKFYSWFQQFWWKSGYHQQFDKFYLLPYAKGV